MGSLPRLGAMINKTLRPASEGASIGSCGGVAVAAAS